VSVSKYGPGYEFLRDFEYTLGADQLNTFGQNQMCQSGRHAARRYGSLVLQKGKGALGPFVRASGQRRVVMSASNWTLGFYDELDRQRRGDTDGDGDGGCGHNDSRRQQPHDETMLIIPENTETNNTLSNNLCDAFWSDKFGGLGAVAQRDWMDIFLPPITARLNANLPGADLTAIETIHMMDLCPFVTVASPTGRLAPFCSLFSTDEWRSYDYYESLGKYYAFGSGNPLGPTLGVGFVNELIARLTGQPVADHTSVNTTLDESPATFPLDRLLYADFSHDNDMMAIYGALGLYNTTASVLPRKKRVDAADAAGFSAAWTIPFAARMYVEKLACPSTGREEYVRVLINDRVVPVPRCSDALGRCRLGDFVESLEFARSGGAWGMCFAR